MVWHFLLSFFITAIQAIPASLSFETAAKFPLNVRKETEPKTAYLVSATGICISDYARVIHNARHPAPSEAVRRDWQCRRIANEMARQQEEYDTNNNFMFGAQEILCDVIPPERVIGLVTWEGESCSIQRNPGCVFVLEGPSIPNFFVLKLGLESIRARLETCVTISSTAPQHASRGDLKEPLLSSC